MYSTTTDNLSTSKCTVVICTRNRPANLRRCIEALQKQVFRPFEILIVDNSTRPSEARLIADAYGSRYHLCTKIGLSHARNAGVAASCTEFIAFLDDDAIPDPDWLLKLLAEFSCAEVAVVTGQVIKEDRDASVPIFAKEHVRIDRNTPRWFEITNFGGIGNGTNMAFRRNALDSWPGFKNCLGRGQLLNAGEDDYAFFTLVQRGHSIVYVPTAQFRHPEQFTGRYLLRSLHRITIVSAYIALLAFEHPSYNPQIYRFLLDSVRRKPRALTSRPHKAFGDCAPTWLVYIALLIGPFLYFYVRLAFFLKNQRVHQVFGRELNAVALGHAKADE